MSDINTGAPAAAPSNTAATPNTNQTTSSSDPVQNLQAQVQSGTPQQKAEAKKMLKNLKIKVDGKEYDEELPFEIPDDEDAREYMTKQLQMSRVGQRRAQEYSQLEKEVRFFVETLRKDPIKALQDPSIGLDVKKLAAQVIEKEIQDSQKSPETLEKEKLEARIKEMEETQKREKEESNQRESERIQQQEFERYDLEMSQALEKSDIPKSPYYIKKMADYMLLGLQEGLDVRPADVLPVVRQEFEEDVKEALSSMSEEAIEKIIGKDVFNRIRKKNISKVKQAPPTGKNVARDVGASKSTPQVETKKQSFKEYFGV
jgi:hypothetical protein